MHVDAKQQSRVSVHVLPAGVHAHWLLTQLPEQQSVLFTQSPDWPRQHVLPALQRALVRPQQSLALPHVSPAGRQHLLISHPYGWQHW